MEEPNETRLSTSESSARISLVGGESKIRSWSVDSIRGEARIAVGTSKRCEWTVSGDGIAPTHFELYWDAESLWIASVAGKVSMNGMPVEGWQQVHGMARVDCGQASFEVETFFVRSVPLGEAAPSSVEVPTRVMSPEVLKAFRDEPTGVFGENGRVPHADVEEASTRVDFNVPRQGESTVSDRSGDEALVHDDSRDDAVPAESFEGMPLKPAARLVDAPDADGGVAEAAATQLVAPGEAPARGVSCPAPRLGARACAGDEVDPDSESIRERFPLPPEEAVEASGAGNTRWRMRMPLRTAALLVLVVSVGLGLGVRGWLASTSGRSTSVPEPVTKPARPSSDGVAANHEEAQKALKTGVESILDGEASSETTEPTERSAEAKSERHAVSGRPRPRSGASTAKEEEPPPKPDPARVKEGADRVFARRYVQARRVYGALAADHPDHEAFGVLAQILERKVAELCAREGESCDPLE